jgi:hypothetical protein
MCSLINVFFTVMIPNHLNDYVKGRKIHFSYTSRKKTTRMMIMESINLVRELVVFSSLVNKNTFEYNHHHLFMKICVQGQNQLFFEENQHGSCYRRTFSNVINFSRKHPDAKERLERIRTQPQQARLRWRCVQTRYTYELFSNAS